MVTKEDIKNLALLSRIELTREEVESLTVETGSIIDFVSQIENFSVNEVNRVPILRNVLREDEITHDSGQYTEDLLSNAPQREEDYLKVKKIL